MVYIAFVSTFLVRGAAEKLKGKVVNLKGYLEARIGAATNNSRLQAESGKDQTSGEIKHAIGRLEDALDERPGNA